MVVVRCASSSAVKLSAIKKAWSLQVPSREIELLALPVELQDRVGLAINAQPEGEAETIRYVRTRWREMCQQHGDPVNLDIIIESGAIDGLDVAVVALYSARGDEVIVQSEGIAFPPGTLDLARLRGFKKTTVGDVIHEHFPNAPNNDWQAYFSPYTSREDQIKKAVIKGLKRLGIS